MGYDPLLRCVVLKAVLSLVAATCRLPIDFPQASRLSGVTIGPENSLVVVSDGGSVLFADLDDFTVRVDQALNDKYKDHYGWFQLEGVAMTNPESTYVYLGMENQPIVLEYEWHSTHRITREFNLGPSFKHTGTKGIRSLTWVPNEASTQQGYFYIGSHMTGDIFIYELPLLDSTGPMAAAKLIDVWKPLSMLGNHNIGGLSYSSRYIFTSYDGGNSNHVLIYPVTDNGLCGELLEQYEVDVMNAQGMAVRKRDHDSWEFFFSSTRREAVFAYTFRFVSGFALHSQCSGLTRHSLRSGARLASILWLVHVGLFYMVLSRVSARSPRT